MVSGIIMASGFSTRLGRNKLMLEVDGLKVVERVIKACKASFLDEIILIYRLDEIKEIGTRHDVKTIYNLNAKDGQSAAVKLGVENAKKENAYMFLVADQPYLSSEVIDNLIMEYEKENKIIIPFYNNKFGMPIIFPPIFREDLLIVKGDKGGREIIKENNNLVKRIYYDDEFLGIDIDTMEDLKRIIPGI